MQKISCLYHRIWKRRSKVYMRSTYHYFLNDHLTGQLDFRNPATAHSVLESTRSSRSQINTWRNQECYSCRSSSTIEEINTHFLPRKLGVDVVDNLVTIVSCRAWPHPNPPECLPQTIHLRLVSLALSQLNPSLGEMSHELYSLVTSTLSRSETTPDSKP